MGTDSNHHGYWGKCPASSVIYSEYVRNSASYLKVAVELVSSPVIYSEYERNSASYLKVAVELVS